VSETPAAATLDRSAADPPRKPARWKNAVRIAIALALLAVVFWIVPWRDRLTWPERFGETPLVGHVVEDSAAAPSADIAFVVDEGAHAGERILIPGSELEKHPKLLEIGLKSNVTNLARSPWSVIGALLLYLVAAMISFQRWHVLLRAVDVDARFWQVQRLGFVGLFFNNIIPGLTGGDLVKAILVAREHPEQRPAAVLSVIVDRAIGLLGLALVASGALLLQHGRFDWMARRLNLILLAIVVAALVVLSRRLRRILLLDRILAAMPFAELLKKLDRAALAYREARWQLAYSVGVSLVVHAMILTAIGVLGVALGIQIRFLDYYGLAPLGLIASSLPLTPGGVGVLEYGFIYFFQAAGVQPAAAFALAVSYRLVQLVVSLIGGVLLLVKHEPKIPDEVIRAS
jgi:uncharacterized protein (TIRG00374 family)